MVQTGSEASFAVTARGDVYMWGETTSGCLGVPSDVPEIPVPEEGQGGQLQGLREASGASEGGHGGVLQFVTEPLALLELGGVEGIGNIRP